MRALFVAAITVLAGCSAVSDTERSLEQCKLDANGATGMEFQRDYAANGPSTVSREDEAYNAFLMSCMKAEGFAFRPPFNERGKFNEACWIKDADGRVQPMPWAGGPACFGKFSG